MQNLASITDIPIKKKEENLLGIENYTGALADFIRTSATPLTIGFQGEWGTGKTSLMNMVREDLEEQKVATAWVNTWEYSLFKEPHEIAPSVLKGLLEDVIRTCKERNYWGNEQKVDEVKKHLKNGAKILTTFVAQAAANKIAGSSIDMSSAESLLSEVAELRSEIQKIISLIINDDHNPVNKIVFFVDDLDRIDPFLAVEILEALKNVFDIENCVFVLAIDYEIVVKGLEKKFGEKTESNEREFRSFFDKIIQLPFSMPINEYKIDKLLENKLSDIGIDIKEKLKADCINFVKLTVGYIPRGIKRYINSFSLLKKIRCGGNQENDDALIEFCLFALIGIQISYPKVFRLISKVPDFTQWDKNFASQIGVLKIEVPDEDYEYTDEEWEQVLWCYCQKDAYLKARAINIIQALNLLRNNIGHDLSIIEKAMKFASMTSVDDDIETKDSSGKYQRTIYRGIEEYIEHLKSKNIASEFIEFLQFLDEDLQNIFNIKEGVNFLYSETGGLTLYANGKLRGTKFAGIDYSAIGGSHINLTLLKDPRQDYKKPKIDGIKITNIRSYRTKWELQNLPFIEYYLIELGKKSDYTDEIQNLIMKSFEIRDQKLKILKKRMHAVKHSIIE